MISNLLTYISLYLVTEKKNQFLDPKTYPLVVGFTLRTGPGNWHLGLFSMYEQVPATGNV